MIFFFIWQIFMASICRLGAIIDVRQRMADFFVADFRSTASFYLHYLLYLCIVIITTIMEINFSLLHPELLFALISGKLSAAVNRRLYRTFRQQNIEVTPEQWTVLYYLWSRDGVTQQELCVSTFKDKPSMTRLIDNLEKLNCVQRVASQADRRINIIKLTPRGRELEQESKPLVFSVIREALTDITQEDITVAYHVLIHIFENLRSSLESK